MIKAASVGLGWWSDELAKSIQEKSRKIRIVSCYSKSKKKELISQKNIIKFCQLVRTEDFPVSMILLKS